MQSIFVLTSLPDHSQLIIMVSTYARELERSDLRVCRMVL